MKRVIGHQQVKGRFLEAMNRGRVHHAWLLHGQKGIGKFTLAQEMAALLLCESHDACGECHACCMVAAGSHPDLFSVSLLEKKRDISIDQVRELLGFLSLSGSESERKIVVLDDAERLNNQSANALLKGLEEPAAGSLLIIVCADAMKLPATVRSRCLLQHCSPLSDEEMKQVLAQEMPDELFKQAEHLELAIKLGDGAPGKISCFEDKKIVSALQEWCELIADIGRADVGKVDNWCRTNVALVPHELIVHALLQPLYPLLQQQRSGPSFEAGEKLFEAVHCCQAWPGDVIRRSLRAAPSLLGCLLQLRRALLNI